MKKLFTTFAIALTLTLVGCGSTESQATNTEYKEETTTTTTTTAKIEEPKEEETTTTTAAPAESEPETTTTAEPEPEVKLEALANSNEITIDDLSAEEREFFESYINENNLSGRFYDHIEMTDDCPMFYFVPSDEYIDYMNSQSPMPFGTRELLFSKKSIYIICNTTIASEYLDDHSFLDTMEKMHIDYVVLRKRSESEADDTYADYFYFGVIPDDWNYICNNVFVPAE